MNCIQNLFKKALWVVCLVVLALGTTVYSIVQGYTSDFASPVECALVFGAVVHGDNRAGPGITRRVKAAVKLYEEDSIERLIFTGGKGRNGQLSEAQVMKDLAVRLGVSLEDILLEEHATSTWENLEFSRSLIEDCEDLVAVSDRYHLTRIRALASLQGIDVLQTYAAAPASSTFEVRSVLREAVGILYYRFSYPYKY